MEAARKCIRMKRTYKPVPENHTKYEKIFAIYREIVEASTPIWDKLARIAND